MSDRPSGAAPARLVAVLGPTNTGKTHLAVERMLGHASGMIGLPLRLLAREIYDRIVRARGPRAVALITGEEKIIPPRPHYFVCTVEAMPLSRQVEFLAVDEIQLCADPERGHVFTHRLLHARGTAETMLLGAATMAPLVRALLPHAEIVSRERFSSLTYAGSKKLTRLPRRSAVVAFSADQVYAIAELIRRQRGGAAVVMGSLSPRTRNAQVELYQSGEVDFLVATDAIGMGLNMDVDHVAFAGLRKFDGRRTRWLRPQEIGQIAGRAGRFRTDGTFGVTGDCDEIDADVVEAVEEHRFEPVEAACWRNPRLDFGSLPNLMRSLAALPDRPGLKLSEESLDEATLRVLAAEPAIADRCRDRSALLRLWDACQTPDFRKTGADDHQRLVRTIFESLTSRRERLPEDWIAGQYAHLDRLDGGIDALSTRLASVRTLAYVANRPDWLVDAAGWQGRTRALEDRLSDTLHQGLMARFVDRRTSALMRGLRVREDMLAGVAADGTVTVEGHYVGRLRGASFEAAQGGSALEQKALRAAAEAAVAPEIARRLGRMAAEPDEAFALSPDGVVLWRGEAAGALSGGAPFSPKVRLYGELGPAVARERAGRRLEAFVASEADRRLAPLRRLDLAIGQGRLKGLARGIAFRLVESGGVIDRAAVRVEAKSLSPVERRALKGLGVRLGAFSLYLPALLKPQPIVDQRETRTTVRMREGETLVIGGLIHEREEKNRQGVPLLSRLPIAGALFRRTATVVKKQEMVVFLTPRVLTDALGALQADRSRYLRLEQSFSPGTPPEFLALSEHARGVRAFEAGDLREAMAHEERAAALAPDHPEFRFNRSLFLAAADRLGEAAAGWSELLRHDVTTAAARADLRALALWGGSARRDTTSLLNPGQAADATGRAPDPVLAAAQALNESSRLAGLGRDREAGRVLDEAIGLLPPEAVSLRLLLGDARESIRGSRIAATEETPPSP